MSPFIRAKYYFYFRILCLKIQGSARLRSDVTFITDEIGCSKYHDKMNRTLLTVLIVFVAIGAGGIIGYTIRGTSVTAPSTEKSPQVQSMSSDSTANNDTDRCTATDLTGSLSTPEGSAAAGNRFYTLTLTNQSPKTCTLNGYPGLSFADSTTAQIGEPADKDTTNASSQMTLKEKESAVATIKLAATGNYPEGTCKDGVTTLRVYPPNDDGFLLVPTDSISVNTWCPGFTTTVLVKS